jgi:hypothetical protein
MQGGPASMLTKLPKGLGAGLAVLVAITASSVAFAPPSAGAAAVAAECDGTFEEHFTTNVVTSFSADCQHRPRARCASPDGPQAPFGEVGWFTTPTFNPAGVPSDSLGGVSVACPSFLEPSEFQDYVLVEGAVELRPPA